MKTPFARPMERREKGRRPCRTSVRVFLEPESTEEDLSFSLDSADLSPDGIFLRTELLFPVGQWLDVELDVPGRSEPVRGPARVVRVQSELEPPGPGMALWLAALSEEERTALARMSAKAVRRPG
jgi:hypothetical protein